MTARGQVTAWAQGQGGALQGTGSGGAHTRVEEMLRGFLEETTFAWALGGFLGLTSRPRK